LAEGELSHRFSVTPPASTTAVMVVEETTGERQCFRIDLDKGEVAPC
jgi:hypothetical protein